MLADGAIAIELQARPTKDAYAGVADLEVPAKAANPRHTTAATKNTAPTDKIPKTPIGRNNSAASTSATRLFPGFVTAMMTATTPRAAPPHNPAAMSDSMSNPPDRRSTTSTVPEPLP